MAQWAKALAAQSHDLNLIPGNHTVENGNNRSKKVVLRFLPVHGDMAAPTHMHIYIIQNK